MKLTIKKGDMVQVISGNDKGKPGRVLNIERKTLRILVEGINVRKKHARPSQTNPNGGIITKEMAIHYSNVMLLVDGKPSRKR